MANSLLHGEVTLESQQQSMMISSSNVHFFWRLEHGFVEMDTLANHCSTGDDGYCVGPGERSACSDGKAFYHFGQLHQVTQVQRPLLRTCPHRLRCTQHRHQPWRTPPKSSGAVHMWEPQCGSPSRHGGDKYSATCSVTWMRSVIRITEQQQKKQKRLSMPHQVIE